MSRLHTLLGQLNLIPLLTSSEKRRINKLIVKADEFSTKALTFYQKACEIKKVTLDEIIRFVRNNKPATVNNIKKTF